MADLTSIPAGDPVVQTEIDAGAVVVAYVHSNNVTYSWHHSMIELVGWDLAHELRVIRGGYIAIRYGTDGITLARNKAVLDFLAERNAEWMFWIDTDMGFPADTVDRLLDVADPVERPIVGALAFTQREEVDDGLGGFRTRATPTIFDWVNTGEQLGFAIRFDYKPDQVTRCGATGSACILVHRTVFERIEEKYGRVWYDRVPNTTTGQVLSEDLAFCLRAGTLEIPIYVHTGVKTTHLKNLWLCEDDYWGQVALANYQSQAEEAATPAATEKVQIVVPTLNRPGNAQPFMDSLRANTDMDLVEVWAMCDVGDTGYQAWLDAGAKVVEGMHTFAEKCNLAVGHGDQPWLFITGDDVKFHPRWLDYAQAAAKGDRFDVVGTNDLGNPRVMRGDHACHMLIRRSYILDTGASWDGPGLVAHEGYRHWFVDDEIVTAAKQRDTWTSSPRAIVEHLHPIWGKSEEDETYRHGQESTETDQRHFTERLYEHTYRSA